MTHGLAQELEDQICALHAVMTTQRVKFADHALAATFRGLLSCGSRGIAQPLLIASASSSSHAPGPLAYSLAHSRVRGTSLPPTRPPIHPSTHPPTHPPPAQQASSSTQQELSKLQGTQSEMVNKLATAERELAQLRSSSRSAEFELVGKQQVRQQQQQQGLWSGKGLDQQWPCVG